MKKETQPVAVYLATYENFLTECVNNKSITHRERFGSYKILNSNVFLCLPRVMNILVIALFLTSFLVQSKLLDMICFHWFIPLFDFSGSFRACYMARGLSLC